MVIPREDVYSPWMKSYSNPNLSFFTVLASEQGMGWLVFQMRSLNKGIFNLGSKLLFYVIVYVIVESPTVSRYSWYIYLYSPVESFHEGPMKGYLVFSLPEDPVE